MKVWEMCGGEATHLYLLAFVICCVFCAVVFGLLTGESRFFVVLNMHLIVFFEITNYHRSRQTLARTFPPRRQLLFTCKIRICIMDSR